MSMLGRVLGLGRNEHYRKAVRLFDQGQFEEALAEFEKAAEHGTGDPLTQRLLRFYTAEAHASLGQTALRRGAWGRAEHHFREALDINPRYADLQFSLAQALRRRLRYADAVAALDEALRINPRFAKARYHRGLTRYAMGEREEGVAEIRESAEVDAAYHSDTLQQAFAAHASGNFAAAQHAFEVVAATQVDDIQFHYRLADDLFRRGLVGDAIREYRTALELNPTYADVRNHLGLALCEAGRHEEAIDEFRRALESNPRFVDAWFNLGNALHAIGREREAAEALQTVAVLDATAGTRPDVTPAGALSPT